MAFTIDDFKDLVELLNVHPEWRGELRRLVLTDELLELPAIVRDLAEAQKCTELRVEELAEAQKRTELRVEELAEAQKRTELRVEELAEAQKRTELRVEELAEAQKRTELRVEELAAAHAEMQRVQNQILQQLGRLAEDMANVKEDLADVKGYVLEQRYRTHAAAYFGTRYRNLRVIEPANLRRVEEAYSEGQFTPREWRSLNKLDALMRGTVGIGSSKREELLALEVSWIIDTDDVELAHERANLLRRLGYAVRAGVGGHDILESARNRARQLNVLAALDGNMDQDEEGLAVE